jgi:serine/threonine-protein kinase
MPDSFRDTLQAALGPNYLLGRELGGGGMSRVFVARESALDRDVVVKVLSPALAQEFSVERFTREIRLAAALQHAHIVPLLSAGATGDGLPFYLMPFVDGEPLRARLARGDRLPVDEIVLVLRDVARALAYAHGRGVVHRDIKPDNVMLSGGAAVVTDFGIAKAVTSAREVAPKGAPEDSLTRMGTSLGTPAYMAPEQGAGDPDTDHRADLYAFGAMAYELLTGETPFGSRPPHALLVAHFTETPASVSLRRPDTPPALAALVMRCLAKDPADRPQTAADILTSMDAASTGAIVTGLTALSTTAGANATTNATTNATATATAAASSPTPRRQSTRARILIGTCILAVVAAGVLLVPRFMNRAPETEGTLVAVMPFNTRDAALQMWREGMVDVLSRSLDGAGPLRTVAPSTTISRSPARADAVSAAALARDVGAGLVLFGDLSAVGPDSVHLRAALFDVRSGKVRHDIDLRGETARIDALADSLSLPVLRALGGAGELAGTQLYSVGTRSLPALKAFLQGQQYYRRGVSDSAARAYQQSVEFDSTFSLGWRGVASIYIRTGRENDPAAQAALDRAIRYKSGRSPRDSMLLRADSLRLAFVRRTPGATDAIDTIPGLAALIATLSSASSQYPSDPELWYEYGDVGFHFGEYGGMSKAQALAAFERGIALDSGALVPYFHAWDLSLRRGDVTTATRYARRIGALTPGDGGVFYQLMAEALHAPPPFTGRAARMLDSVPVQWVASLAYQLANAPDSGGTARAIARRLLAAPPARRAELDSAGRLALVAALAARGAFDEAVTAREGPATLVLLGAMARVGAIPRDSALAMARSVVRNSPDRASPMARFLADNRDTASLALMAAWGRSADAKAAAAGPGARRSYLEQQFGAFLAAARGDSTGAVRALLALPMTACSNVPCGAGLLASLLAASGRDRDAAIVLDRWLPSTSSSMTAPMEWLLRGQIAERLGDRETAAVAYRRVITMWGDGEPAARRVADEARRALQRVMR